MRKLCVFLACFALTLCCVTFSVRADNDIAVLSDSYSLVGQTSRSYQLYSSSLPKLQSGNQIIYVFYFSSDSHVSFPLSASYCVCSSLQLDDFPVGADSFTYNFSDVVLSSQGYSTYVSEGNYLYCMTPNISVSPLESPTPTPTLTPSPSPVPTVAPDVNYNFTTDDYPYIVIFLLGVLVCLTLFKR